MSVSIMRIWTALALVGFVVLSGCVSSEPVLESRSAVVPAGVDLSGRWVLQGGEDALQRPRGDTTPLIETRTTTRQRIERVRKGSSVHVFLEFGESLKISQTQWSLFISYDRAIVEEYTFGENRLVNVGPIEAKRASGWDRGAFVVDTLDTSGAQLFESWTLDGADNLVRTIRITEDDRVVYSTQQRFARE